MKTSYFSRSATTPGAISIARYPPKGVTIPSYQKLAPTYDMIHMTDFEAYSHLYRERILSRLNPQDVYDELCVLAYPYEPILLCFERDKNGCHRSLVAKWLEENLDVDVREMGYTPPVRQMTLGI